MIRSDVKTVSDRCEMAVPRLMEDWGLDGSGGIRRTEGSGVNPSFSVADRHVIRFNTRDYAIPKFRRELRAYGRLGERVPVPAVRFLDESRERVPYDVIALEKLPGEALAEAWKEASVERRRVWARQAGGVLAKIHACGFDFFGEVWCGEFQRWSTSVKAKLKGYLREARSARILKKDDTDVIRQVVEAQTGLLEEVERPVLVHGDFHRGNLLVNGGELTGVVDFEWCMAGDPEWDLATLQEGREFRGDARKAFEEGYGRRLDASGAVARRRAVYSLIRDVAVLSMAHRQWSDETCNERLEDIRERVEALRAG